LSLGAVKRRWARQLRNPLWRQNDPVAFGQVAELQATKLRAMQRVNVVTDGGKHASNLMIAAFRDR